MGVAGEAGENDGSDADAAAHRAARGMMCMCEHGASVVASDRAEQHRHGTKCISSAYCANNRTNR